MLHRRREAVDDAAADGDLSDMPSIVPTILAIIYVDLAVPALAAGGDAAVLAGAGRRRAAGAIRVTQRAVNNLLRPVGTEASRTQTAPPSITAAIVERGARTILIVAAALFIAWAWDVDLGARGARPERARPHVRGRP